MEKQKLMQLFLSNPTASIRPSASSDGVIDIFTDTTTTTSTSETTTTTSSDNILGTDTTVTATGGSFLIDGIVTASIASTNTQSTTTLLMYGVIKDETSTNTRNIPIPIVTDTSDSIETTSSTDNAIVFDAESVSSISIPMTNTLFSTYFISTGVTVTIPKKSFDFATMVDTGTPVAFSDLTDTALQKADTASRSSALATGDTVPIPLGTTNAFTSSAAATSSSDSTDTTISGTCAPNEIISTTRLNDGTETSRGATTAGIPELIPRSAEPPCNLARDCSFTTRNERTFPSDIQMKPLLPDVAVMPELLSVLIPDIPVEVPYSSFPMPDISCCDIPPRVPKLNISPSEEGKLSIATPDVPLFNETLQSKPFTNDPPTDSPLITLSSTQIPLYIILQNIPLPDKPLPAVSPKELRFDDPSTDVSLVDVLTPDIPSPAVPRPNLPLLDIPPEVPRLDEIPPDTLPTYLSPVDVLTPDILSTTALPLDIVPGTLLSKSQDNLREPLLDAVSAKVPVVSLVSSSEQVGHNAVPDKTIDQPDSVIDLPPVKFNFSLVDVSKSFDPMLDSVPVFVDDPQNISDDSSAPTNNLITKPLESVLEQPNKNDKVNDETGSMGLISSSQNSESEKYKLDLTQEEESLVVQAEGQSSTVESIQESENKGPEDKNIEDQNQETGTKCSSDW